MEAIASILADNFDTWTSAIERKSIAGRGRSRKFDFYGIEKLRALILDLAIRGKLVPQDIADEPAEMLLKRIAKEKARLVGAGQLRRSKGLPVTGDFDLPFALPVGWAVAPLDQISPRSISDGDWIETKDQSEDGGVRLIQLADVGEGTFLNKSARYVTEETELRLKCTRLKVGDVLVARLPNPIGRACIFPDIGQPAITAVDVAIISLDANVSSQFVVLAINAPLVREQIESYGKGATRFRVSTGHLKTVRIPVPPLEEQRRIVAKVHELMGLCDVLEAESDEAIEAHELLVESFLAALTGSKDADVVAENWARIELHFDVLFTTEASIDLLKKTILQLAVTGKLIRQNPNDEPATEYLRKMAVEKARLISSGKIKRSRSLPQIHADEIPFALPSGWEWVRFEETTNPEFTISYGVLVPGSNEEGGIPFVRIADLSITAPSEKPEKSISEKIDAQYERTRLHGGEILMGVVGSIGKLGVAPESWRGANIARAICRIMPSKHLSKNYILWLLQSEFMQENFRGDTRTLAQPTLNINLIRSAMTPLPPLQEQERIATKLFEIMGLCDVLKVRLEEARQGQVQFADAVASRIVA